MKQFLDSEFLQLIDNLPATPLTRESLPQFRRNAAHRFAAIPSLELEPSLHRVTGKGAQPDIPVLLYRPVDLPAGAPVLLHMHGGGMFSGTAQLSPYSSAAVALAGGFAAMSVDYRLAPETVFPGQIEDCYAALGWLFREAASLGLDPDRVALSGDSAGGGLAAALALMARDRGEFRPFAQVLTYPMLDCRTGGPDCRAGSESADLTWTRAQNRFAWDVLRGDYLANDARCGWFSPSLTANLSGLPPAFIAVGALDLFRNECAAYAARLLANGVAAELQIYPGAPHAFNAVPAARVTRTWRGDLAGFLAGL